MLHARRVVKVEVFLNLRLLFALGRLIDGKFYEAVAIVLRWVVEMSEKSEV